jgi:hypothetical protein
MSRYAASTKVSPATSQAEIKRTVLKYGAKSFGFFEDGDRAVVLFEAHDRRIRFNLSLPPKSSKEFTFHSRGVRTPSSAHAQWEQACRQRWRALLLAIKAKLESVEAGIESFEEAFLSHIVLPEGETFGERATGAIAIAYSGKPLPPLLASPGGGA